MNIIRRRSTALLASLAAGFLCVGLWLTHTGAQENPPIRLASLEQASAALSTLSEAYIAVAEKVRPAVVNIMVTEARKTPQPGRVAPRMDQMDPFRRFFGEDFFREFRQFEAPEDIPRAGVGSGVIVDTTHGYILTNNHVVGGADKIKVTLNDEREFDADVVGADKASDVAVLKIKETKNKKISNLTAAPLGDSDALRVGEIVMAVGSPFNLMGSVSQGIVSAIGRQSGILGRGGFENFIQTDAAVNPGNSGGPLVNLRGEVVGINSAIATSTGQYAGVSFAVPINLAHGVMNDLVSKGKVSRGYLGVEIGPVDEAMARRFGLDKPSGALVATVVPGGPAAKAGLKPYDIITELNGVPVKNATILRLNVADMRPGDNAKLKLARDDGAAKEVTVRIAERPSEEALASGKPQEEKESAEAEVKADVKIAELGLEVQTLSPELAARLGAKDDRGVIVTSVEPGSPAYERGIREDAVIKEVEKKPVANAVAFKTAVADALKKNGSVLLRIRGAEGGTVPLIIEPKEK